MSEEHRRGDYVRKVQEGTRRYTLDLLSDNKELRARLAQREAECGGLADRLRMMEPYISESLSLKSLTASLARDKESLEERLALAEQEIQSRECAQKKLEQGLARVEDENRRRAELHSRVEQQNSDLANLYVASYRLLGALDRADLLAALFEIVANVIGCEEVIIFERGPAGGLQLAGSSGVDPEPFRHVAFGQGIVGHCAASGDLFVAENSRPAFARPQESQLSACIPLKFHGEVTGALALFRLLPQKVAGYEDLDREVFDLLATHAATAMYCSALHTAKCQSAA